MKYLIIIFSIITMSLISKKLSTGADISTIEIRKKDTVYKVETISYKQKILLRDYDKNEDILFIKHKKTEDFKLKKTKIKNLEDGMLIPHGKLEYFSKKDNQIVKIENYVYGRLSGETKYYYPDGTVKKIECYNNSKKHGYWFEYDTLGLETSVEYYFQDMFQYKLK